MSLDSLLRPRSIAILGASEDFVKISGRPLKFLLDKGYPGRILPVNPKYERIAGLPCYPSIAAVPETVDMAIVAVPAGAVLEALEQCVAKGVRAAVVFSSGFGEMGAAGRDHEHRRAIMKDSGIGAFGAIGLILAFLLGWTALDEMPGGMRWRVLLVALPLGRTAPLLVGRVFRARTVPGGLGAQFAAGVSSPAVAGWGTAMLAVAAVLLWPGGVLVWLLALAAVMGWSVFLVRRFGGLGGDVLGSGVEVGELACLLTAAALIHLGLL